MSQPTTSRASRRELWIVAAVLLLVGAAMYGPYVVNGSFTIDDWGHAAAAKYFRDGILDSYWEVTSNRPVLVLYVPLTHIVFGPHPWLHNAWSIVLAVTMATVLYALLRRLGLQIRHAGFIALLVLLFPWSDAARFWATASHINLGITFALGGVLAALRGLDARAAGQIGRERILHVGAVMLYALSVLTYEIAGVVLLFAGALYFTRASWRVVCTRWAIDSAVVAACLAWSAIEGNREKPSLQEMIAHARSLSHGAITLFAQATIPFGHVNRWFAIVLLAVVLGAAGGAWAVRSADDDTVPMLRRWLITAAGGLLVAAAGWALYIPASPYYEIDGPGVGNRTNVMAAVGVITVVYSVIVLMATLLFGRTSNWKRTVNVASAVLAAMIAIGYARDTHRDEQAWTRTAGYSDRMLAAIKSSVPQPSSGSTIYTFDYPASEVPGIVIFGYSWDLEGAVKLTYNDPTLNGYPIMEGTTIRCGRHHVGPSGPGWTYLQSAPYGKAYFVDVPIAKSERVDSRNECLNARSRFRPGPSIGIPEPQLGPLSKR